MYRSKRLLLLLGALAAVCAATIAVLQLEERREKIENSGAVILEIPGDTVQALSWTYGEATLSFHKDQVWLYDEDAAFPVDGDQVSGMLEQFQALSAAFVIEDVEDFGQYGLDDPTCTIVLETETQHYEILLGDYSTMDAQRYVSIGDGNVYLVTNDPLEQFDAVLEDMIDHDETPSFDQVAQLQFQFSDADGYTAFYQEDSTATYCAEDVYFTRKNGTDVPLDTDRVEDYLSQLSTLDLSSYVTYNVTDEELAAFGLDSPELTVTVDYTAADEEGSEYSDTFVLHVSRPPEEQGAAEEDSGEDEEITAYARVGDSQIVYQITSLEYTDLMAAAYDDLRHLEVLTADFADVQQIDVRLEGTVHTFTAQDAEGERTWLYNGTEVDFDTLQSAISSLQADSFTDEQPAQQEEISLTVHLDNENFPQVEIQLYRYDGEHCLAVVDGQPVSLVPRSQAVDLMEAVQAVVLG